MADVGYDVEGDSDELAARLSDPSTELANLGDVLEAPAAAAIQLREHGSEKALNTVIEDDHSPRETVGGDRG